MSTGYQLRRDDDERLYTLMGEHCFCNYLVCNLVAQIQGHCWKAEDTRSNIKDLFIGPDLYKILLFWKKDLYFERTKWDCCELHGGQYSVGFYKKLLFWTDTLKLIYMVVQIPWLHFLVFNDLLWFLKDDPYFETKHQDSCENYTTCSPDWLLCIGKTLTNTIGCWMGLFNLLCVNELF